MAHALPEARSVLMFRAARDDKGQRASNVRWNYGHTTIPATCATSTSTNTASPTCAG